MRKAKQSGTDALDGEFDLGSAGASRSVLQGQVGWSQVTDEHLWVAGLDAVARHFVVRQTLHAIEEALEGSQRARLEEASALWGTYCSAMVLRRLTEGGKRTWRESRSGKPGLLQLVGDVECPAFLLKRRIPDSIWLAQRRALAMLQDFTVDVSSKRLRAFQADGDSLRIHALQQAGAPVSSPELHRRVAQVYRFYGVGKPVRTQSSTRMWRFYPWRMTRIDHQFEVYRSVRLASLDWLPASHFASYLAL